MAQYVLASIIRRLTESQARAVLANADKPSPLDNRGSVSPSTLSWSSSYQAYVDLLKASYILYDVVLRTGNPEELFLNENRKMVSDLSEVSSSSTYAGFHLTWTIGN